VSDHASGMLEYTTQTTMACSCSVTCPCFAYVVSNWLCVNGEGTNLQHVAALIVRSCTQATLTQQE